jgi:hypothetical protein
MRLRILLFELLGRCLRFKILLFELLGRCLRPGLLRARFARLLLRNELNPAYPYHIFITCCITSALVG